MPSEHKSGFVSGGYCNLVKGIEDGIRKSVEARYADEWNASGLLKRWRLQRRMDREVKTLVNEAMPNVSSSALF